MSWKDHLKYYSDGGSSNSRKTEDLVARRVCRGLGFVSGKLRDVCIGHGVSYNYDEPLWPNVKRLIDVLSGGNTNSDVHVKPHWLMELREISGDSDILSDADSVAAAAKGTTAGVIILCRVGDSDAGYVFIEDRVIPEYVMTPTCTLVYRKNGILGFRRSIESLISGISEYEKWDKIER